MAEHVAQLRSHNPGDSYPMLQGLPPREVIVQDTLDISGLVQFYWYEPVWYSGSINRKGFPDSGEKLGRMLGIAHNQGQAMCLYVALLQSENPTINFVYNSISKVHSVLPEELNSRAFKTKLSTSDNSIELKCGDPVTKEGPVSARYA